MSRELRTYTFTAAVEPADEGMWHAYCPTLLAYGAATWGTTREEVLAHIGEMAGMIVERLVEEGAPIPVAPDDQEPTAGERIVVTVCARSRTRRIRREPPIGGGRPVRGDGEPGLPRVIHRAGEKPVHGGGDVRRAFEAAASVAGPISPPHVITVGTVHHDDCEWSTHTASGQCSCPRQRYIRPHRSTYHASHRRGDCLWSRVSG